MINITVVGQNLIIDLKEGLNSVLFHFFGFLRGPWFSSINYLLQSLSGEQS